VGFEPAPSGKVKETDLDSVMVLPLARRKLGRLAEETFHERVLRHILIGKKQLAVSRFRACASDRSETDLDSVVITAWLRLIERNDQ